MEKWMRQMRIAIVEDEKITQQELAGCISRYFKNREIHCQIEAYDDGDEIMENYTANFDLIFLDIQMARLDGIRTAEKIRGKDEDVLIVFVTSLGHLAIHGYAVQAFDFLVKPVTPATVNHLLDRIVRTLEKRKKNYITLPMANGLIRLDADLVRYVEIEGHYLIFHSDNGDYRVRVTMKEMETSLTEMNFYRCNSGYMVNLKRVEGVDGNDVIIGNSHIPISRPRHKAFLEELTRYIGNTR